MASSDPTTLPAVAQTAPLRARTLPYTAVLAIVLLLEALLFTVVGHNFLTARNGFEMTRFATELGLLALALTPVILTGGIDLSVGSMIGLSAVTFGALTSQGLPLFAGAAISLLIGTIGGLLNGAVVTLLRAPPLIATLATFSLFRGLAEAITGGATNYTGFDPAWLFLGQGYLPGGIPAQLPILTAAAIVYALLVHRTTIGRGWRAIGFSPEGARHAGIPVRKRVLLVYALAGLMAAVAGLIYAARLGQAKADAGTGYELAAITAVVLGGTSIHGGRGGVGGTLLGLAVVVVLQTGLRLSDLPSELAGVCTGLLLVLALLTHRALARRRVA